MRKPAMPAFAALCLAGVATVTAAPVQAQTQAPPSSRTSISTDLYGRMGPEGVMLVVGLNRHRGFADGESQLARGRYALFGASLGANPAYGQASVFAEWVPVAVLQLRLQYDAFLFFGSNGALVQMPSASAGFGKADLDALAGTERTGIGHRLMASPVLRARVGPVLLRNQTDVAWYDLSRSDGWYYEWEYDTLLSSNDLLVSNRLASLFVLWERSAEQLLVVGPAYEVTRARDAGITRQRLEGVLFWSPTQRLGGIARPRVLGVVGVNVVDRNREGELFATVGLGGDLDL